MTDEKIPAADPAACPASDRLRGRRAAAVVLMIVAVTALVAPRLPFHWREAMLLAMGIGFIVWAALARSPGLLVPGGILTGIGAGVLLRPVYGNAAFLFAMAGGFVLVGVLSRLIFGRSERWPLWPAAGLGFAGLMSLAGPDARAWFREIGPYWPYALIAVALWLFFAKPAAKG